MTDGSAQCFMILISAQDSPEFRIQVPAHSNDGYQDPKLWLREPVVLNISIHQGLVVCSTCESHTYWRISVFR